MRLIGQETMYDVFWLLVYHTTYSTLSFRQIPHPDASRKRFAMMNGVIESIHSPSLHKNSSLSHLFRHSRRDLLPTIVARIILHVSPAIDNSIHGLVACRFGQIAIVSDTELLSALLGSQEGQEDDVRVHAAQEDANDETILISLCLSLGWERETLTDGAFDGGTGATDEVTELVGCSNYECSEGALFSY